MSVSDPGEKIEWGAESEPRKNERVPSSANPTTHTISPLANTAIMDYYTPLPSLSPYFLCVVGKGSAFNI